MTPKTPVSHPVGKPLPSWTQRLYGYAESLRKLPFVQGVAKFQLGSFATALIGLVTSVCYARLLGLTEFGSYAVISAFVGLVTIVTSYGQETATITFLAEAAGKHDTAKAHAVLRYYAQATIVAGFVYILLFLALPSLADMFHQDVRLGILGRILLINTALQWPNSLLFIALQLQHRIGLVAIIENTLDAIQAIVAIALILCGWGILGILISTISMTALSVPIFLLLYERSAAEQGFPGLWEMFTSAFRRGREGAEYAMQGLWISLDQQIGKNLYPNLFYMTLNATTSPAIVGLFRIAFRLAQLPVNYTIPAISRMATFSIPRIATRDTRNLLSACKKVMLGTALIVLLFTIGGAMIVPPLIPIVYGRAFAASIPAFILLLPMNFFASAHIVSIPLLRVYKRIWLMSITNALSVCMGLGAYYFFLQLTPALTAMSLAIVLFHLCTLSIFYLLYRIIRTQRTSPISS